MSCKTSARDRETVLEVRDGGAALRALQREHVVCDAEAVSGHAAVLLLGVVSVGRAEPSVKGRVDVQPCARVISTPLASDAGAGAY